MSNAGIIAAGLLAGLFLWASVVKFGDRPGVASSFEELELPRPAVLAVVVPSLELALAAGLILTPGWAGPVAFAVLFGFTLFLIQVIRSGVATPCACFGVADQMPVTWVSIARNGALMVAALLATAAPATVW